MIMFLCTVLRFLLLKQVDMMDPNEEILYHFMQTQMEVLDELEKHPFQHSFDWRKILTEGKTRRISMDSELRRLTKTKKKLSKSYEQ